MCRPVSRSGTEVRGQVREAAGRLSSCIEALIASGETKGEREIPTPLITLPTLRTRLEPRPREWRRLARVRAKEGRTQVSMTFVTPLVEVENWSRRWRGLEAERRLRRNLGRMSAFEWSQKARSNVDPGERREFGLTFALARGLKRR